MICRITEFMIENKLTLPSDVTVHSKECRHDECKESGTCGCFKNPESKLSKHNFGWTLSHVVNLEPARELLNKTFSTAKVSLRLIHPVHSSIWVTQLDDDNYVLSIDGKARQCISLKELNYQLKSLDMYDGRDLTEEDFNYED